MSDLATARPEPTSLRQRVYRTLEAAPPLTRIALVIRTGIIGLILLSTCAVILESVEAIRLRMRWELLAFEWLAVAVFTAEYAGRLWAITEDPRYSHPIRGRLRYAITPLAIIDLLAIAPAYLSFGAASQLLTLRSLRLVRIFRLFKLAHYSVAMRSLGGALASKRREITVVLFVLSILLVIASSLMYHVENEAQPDRFSSIPAAMWWAVATLTTVGYGDVYPLTPLGKLIGSFVAVLGAGFFALPAAIWGAAFIERALRQQRPPSVCPHCGRSIADAEEARER